MPYGRLRLSKYEITRADREHLEISQKYWKVFLIKNYQFSTKILATMHRIITKTITSQKKKMW